MVTREIFGSRLPRKAGGRVLSVKEEIGVSLVPRRSAHVIGAGPTMRFVCVYQNDGGHALAG